MKRLLTLIASVAMIAFTGTSLVRAETVLTYSSWIPWTHPVNTSIYIPWMEAIEKDSNGSIKFGVAGGASRNASAKETSRFIIVDSPRTRSV